MLLLDWKCNTYKALSLLQIGGYADISRLHAWNLDFVENLPAGNRYREMSSKVIQDHISAYRLISLDSVAAPSYP